MGKVERRSEEGWRRKRKAEIPMIGKFQKFSRREKVFGDLKMSHQAFISCQSLTVSN